MEFSRQTCDQETRPKGSLFLTGTRMRWKEKLRVYVNQRQHVLNETKKNVDQGTKTRRGQEKIQNARFSDDDLLFPKQLQATGRFKQKGQPVNARECSRFR